MNKPVLFIVFNRFDTAQKVFEQIRIAKPPRLYIASDGARENVENEKAIVENIRKWILENIDWDCEVKTLFREENLGCDINISKAISTFFENETDGIILEDDCLPSQSFFKYCEMALDKYKNDKHIWHIGGSNSKNIHLSDNTDIVYTSKCMLCWGWATWADRWKYFNSDLNNYNIQNIRNTFDKISWQIYWLRILYRCLSNQLNTWDYQWALNIMEHGGICLYPCKNLIKNIGFDGTHYRGKKKSKLLSSQQNFEIENINLPDKIVYNRKYDDLIFKHFYRIQSFMFKFILRFFAELVTLNYNGESSTIIRQVIGINKKKRK